MKGTLQEVCENLDKKDIIQEILKYVKTLEESQKQPQAETLNDGLNVVPLEIVQPISIHDKLEYHRNAIDIHYVLQGKDTYRIKPLVDCKSEFQAYNAKDDYGLFEDQPETEFTLTAGQAVFIDTDMAHMALCGKGLVKKLVFKIQK
jgi:YhcH/YjgK/YiaL family protein